MVATVSVGATTKLRFSTFRRLNGCITTRPMDISAPKALLSSFEAISLMSCCTGPNDNKTNSSEGNATAAISITDIKDLNIFHTLLIARCEITQKKPILRLQTLKKNAIKILPSTKFLMMLCNFLHYCPRLNTSNVVVYTIGLSGVYAVLRL